ncbi:MAG TPA: DUF3368 domain-containing protein [Planctomycetes bacterium]|nr:DUF3368 domain-containing protein [Planctomycetota bacterium]
MIVVSDASPMLNLAAIHRLDLLRALYERVAIPETVHAEIAGSADDLPGALEFKAADWIEVRRPGDTALVTTLRAELHAGEAEAIALAHELRADLILLDERKGRAAAARLNLRVVGLLGVLVEAKHKGLVPALKPLLHELTTRAGFWIGKELFQAVLIAAGE